MCEEQEIQQNISNRYSDYRMQDHEFGGIDYQWAMLWEVVRRVLAEVNTTTEGFH